MTIALRSMGGLVGLRLPGSTREQARHVHIYAHASTITEGYHELRIAAEGYTGNDVQLLPMMHMLSQTHSGPASGLQRSESDGYFYGAVFFQMPSTVDDSGNVTEPWKLHVVIGGNDTATAEVRVNPHSKGWVRRRLFPNNLQLLYEFRPGSGLRTGTVPLELYVYRRDMSQPMTEPSGFPSAHGFVARVLVNTWMPTMDHGAPGNQEAQPQASTFGLYKGQLGFNMTGDWDVYLAFVGTNNDTLGLDTIEVQVLKG